MGYAALMVQLGTKAVALVIPLLAGCSATPAPISPDLGVADRGTPDLGVVDRAPLPPDRALDADARAIDAPRPDARTSFTVVTFNTGTSESMGHDQPPDDGYSSAHAKLSDLYYGDGLAWSPAIKDATAFFAALDPDLVVFQEIFYSADCLQIPATATKDFVCETWSPGDPTVAQTILGPGWQVACHPGKPDKCAAVKKSFGSFRGCASDFCLEGLAGSTIAGCGKGARVGRGVIDLVGGGELTLVNVHASSGVTGDDQDCRTKQVEQVFVDLGDGKPAASGLRNLILGDFNTDPGRLALLDKSAARWNDFVGAGKAFHFISPVGPFVPPTYAGLFNIDHAVSDAFSGSCWVPGSAGKPPVSTAIYFDHKPLVCTLKLPPP
jgi:hypothetical protein